LTDDNLLSDKMKINLLSDKMKINLHMLGALMLNRVGGEVHGADITTVDKGAPRRRSLELMEQLSQPGGLNHVVGNGTIFGLSAGARDDGLPLDRQSSSGRHTG
jgi:hypothetical protein